MTMPGEVAVRRETTPTTLSGKRCPQMAAHAGGSPDFTLRGGVVSSPLSRVGRRVSCPRRPALRRPQALAVALAHLAGASSPPASPASAAVVSTLPRSALLSRQVPELDPAVGIPLPDDDDDDELAAWPWLTDEVGD